MMIPPKQIIIAFTAITASNALILHPSPPPIFRRNLIALHVLNNNDDYDGRPSYRRYQRDSGGESKNRFRTTNNSNYNTNNNSEDEAYELARELASRRGLNLSSRDYNTEQPPPPMDSYTADYDYVPPTYGSDYGGVSEQELPRIPMDYNSANRNYDEGYGSRMGGGGLKELTWGGLKEQNDQRLNERYNTEVRRSSSSSTSVGRRYKNPQPPRQPPREVRPTDYRSSRNDRLYQSGPSSQRSQASMGRRANTNYDQVMRGSRTQQQQQPRQPPPPLKRSNTGYGSYEEVKRVNKLSELASTSERMDGPAARRHMSQYPGPNNNAPYNNRPNNNIPYEQPPFRPPSTMSGFAPTAEQMGRSVGSVPPPQFMPPQQQQPPPPYVQMPQYQQQQQQRGRQARNNLRPPTSIPLSQLALQPHIQPVDQPSSQQQSSSFSAEFAQQQQQSQQMSGGYNDRRQQQQPPPPSSFSAGRNQSESFGSNPSASFTPLPFQQLSQADFTRPFQGGSSEQQSQQQSTSSSGAARQSRPEFGGGGGPPPPPEFGGPPPGFDQGAGPPPPFGQGPPPPPPPFGPDVHIFQNPFMNDPMFQRPQTTPTTQRKPNDENVKVPKDPNIEKMRRRAVSNSSSSSSKNNPGSGMKIPKDPVIERRRRQQQQQQEQQSTSQSTKVPRDPFLERQRNQQRTQGTSARSSSRQEEEEEEVRVPKEPTRLRTTQPTEERRPKEPKPKTSNDTNIRIPREPTMNASKKDKTPKEPQRNNNSRVDGKGDDMTYEDFASFFDMPKL